MSVRVIARVRPLLKSEHEKDQIVNIHNGTDDKPSIVKVPNPKNLSEEYSFQFSRVYGQESTQQEIYDAEGSYLPQSEPQSTTNSVLVTPSVKHLFQGCDVTIFAYGTTGSGKTHTMRGGRSLADRGMIPRLLSSIFRKRKAIEKANEETTVLLSMSYYEIYNDRVFDLFDAPEKRTATGLPIREAEGGKTVVVGLTEVSCDSLKEFEVLYDKANMNRSTGATKLNAHSSRSHAVLCVKVTISTPTETRVSTASAIDLAGSEDNRRTGNGKDRMVESASINKSLFVLAQCVEAISKKQQRIPYRESKMTRILSLGQNNGFTIMILNLPPVKAFHLDTLSSLNFANRTKKIEVREIENEPLFKGPPRPTVNGNTTALQRKPLQPLSNHVNINLTHVRDSKSEKPLKQFSVYSDRSRNVNQQRSIVTKTSPLKRSADVGFNSSVRPIKQIRTHPLQTNRSTETMSKATIEALVEKKVSEALAGKAISAPAPPSTKDISAEVQARLDSIEKRLEGQEGERAEGLSYLFMAKQHQARGENFSALKMYELAQPYFEGNEKLQRKIEKLRTKIAERKTHDSERDGEVSRHNNHTKGTKRHHQGEDDSFCEDHQDVGSDDEYEDDEYIRKRKVKPSQSRKRHEVVTSCTDTNDHASGESTPRTKFLLDIFNSRDIQQMKSLNGLGVKRAETIMEHLTHQNVDFLQSWNDIIGMDVRGIGKKSWESMREGVHI